MDNPDPPAHDPVALEPCADLLRARARMVFKHVPKALTGHVEAIHQLRVAGRRLRVTLPLLARKPRGRRVRRTLRALRQLTRTAGTSRDLDVIGGLLDGTLRERAATPETQLLTRHLAQARRRSRARMVERLLDLDISLLRKDLRAILERGPADLFTVLSRVRDSRDFVGDEALAGFAELGDRYDPVALHAIRRKARRLRYTAEVLRAIRQPGLEAPALLRELQEQLGGVHDCHVLAAWLGGQATRAERQGRTELGRTARELEQLLVERAIQSHRAALAAAPAALLERALELMGRSRTAA